MILHDAIKTIQNGYFLFSLKKEQNFVSFKKKKKTFLKTNKKIRWVVFLEKRAYSTLVITNAEGLYFIPCV